MLVVESNSLAKNTLIYTGASVIQKILTFIAFWLLSTSVDRDALGTYTFAFAFVSFFSFLNDLGLVTVLTREASRHNREKQEEHFNAVLSLKIPLTLLMSVVTLVALFLAHRTLRVDILVLMALFILALDGFTQSFYGIIRANQNFKYESIGLTIFQVINIVLTLLVLVFTKEVAWIISTIIASGIFNFFYAYWVVKYKMKIAIKFLWKPSVIRHLLSLTPAFTAALIISKLYNNTDSLILGFLRGVGEVGLYSIPAKASTALQALIPMAFVITLFPAFSYYFDNSREKLKKIFEKSIGYLLMTAMPTALGLYILIPKILAFIWPSYLEAARPFEIMTMALPFAFLSFPTGYFLNACNQPGKTTLNRGIGLAINIIMNIILIPRYGVLGAAISFAATNVIQFILDMVFVYRIIRYNWRYFIIILAKSTLAAIMMNLAISFFIHLNLIMLVVVGLIIYLSVLLLTKPFDAEEWAVITNVFKKKAQQAGPPVINNGISAK